MVGLEIRDAAVVAVLIDDGGSVRKRAQAAGDPAVAAITAIEVLITSIVPSRQQAPLILPTSQNANGAGSSYVAEDDHEQLIAAKCRRADIAADG